MNDILQTTVGSMSVCVRARARAFFTQDSDWRVGFRRFLEFFIASLYFDRRLFLISSSRRLSSFNLSLIS